MAIELDLSTDAVLQQTLEYWQRMRGQRQMPTRKDLDPADIPRLLRKLMLADVTSDVTSDVTPGETGIMTRAAARSEGPQIRVRLVGTEVVGRFGYELTGYCLSEIDYGNQSDEIASLYREAVASAQPQFARIEFWQGSNRRMRMQHLLLPLSDDGKTVNMILAVVHCL